MKPIDEAESIRMLMFMSIEDLSKLKDKVSDHKDAHDIHEDLKRKTEEAMKRLNETIASIMEHRPLIGRPAEELLSNINLVLDAKKQTLSTFAKNVVPEEKPKEVDPPVSHGTHDDVLIFDERERFCIARMGNCDGCRIKAEDSFCKVKNRTKVRQHIEETHKRLERLKKNGPTGARSSKNVRAAQG